MFQLEMIALERFIGIRNFEPNEGKIMNNRFEFWKNLLPEITYTDLVAVVIITIAAILLFSRNMFIDNGVVFPDEYLYKVSADRQLNQAFVLERGLLGLQEPMPNRFFLSLYGFGSYFGSNYYLFAQFLNVIFWALGLLALFRLAVLSGLSHYASIFYLVSVTLLPFSAYTKYFMPESMFFFMFSLGVYALFVGTQKRKYSVLFLSGVVVGLAYFVKPHAVFLFLASILFFFLVRDRNRFRLIGVYSAGAFLSMTLGQVLLLGSSCASAYLCGYGKTPGNLLGKIQSYYGEFWKLVSDFLYVSEGHFIFLFSVFGIAFLLAVAVSFPRLRLLGTNSSIPESIKLLSSYTVLLSILLVAISILFSVLNGEMGRVHSRYYFFVFPLLMLIIFHAASLHLTKFGMVAGALLCSSAVILLVSIIGNYSAILPVSLVSDGPELGFAFISNPVLYLCAILLIGTSLLLLSKPQNYGWLVGTIIILSLLSNASVFTKQKGLFRGLYTTGQDAIAVEQIIGKEAMDRVVIVGENRDIVSKFLFFLSSAPNIDYLAGGESIERALNKFPESTRLVAISGAYYFPDWLDCSPVGKTVTMCSVSR